MSKKWRGRKRKKQWVVKLREQCVIFHWLWSGDRVNVYSSSSPNNLMLLSKFKIKKIVFLLMLSCWLSLKFDSKPNITIQRKFQCKILRRKIHLYFEEEEMWWHEGDLTLATLNSTVEVGVIQLLNEKWRWLNIHIIKFRLISVPE